MKYVVEILRSKDALCMYVCMCSSCIETRLDVFRFEICGIWTFICMYLRIHVHPLTPDITQIQP